MALSAMFISVTCGKKKLKANLGQRISRRRCSAAIVVAALAVVLLVTAAGGSLCRAARRPG